MQRAVEAESAERIVHMRASPTMRMRPWQELGGDALMHAVDVGVLDIPRPGQVEEMLEALACEIMAQLSCTLRR